MVCSLRFDNNQRNTSTAINRFQENFEYVLTPLGGPRFQRLGRAQPPRLLEFSGTTIWLATFDRAYPAAQNGQSPKSNFNRQTSKKGICTCLSYFGIFIFHYVGMLQCFTISDSERRDPKNRFAPLQINQMSEGTVTFELVNAIFKTQTFNKITNHYTLFCKLH